MVIFVKKYETRPDWSVAVTIEILCTIAHLVMNTAIQNSFESIKSFGINTAKSTISFFSKVSHNHQQFQKCVYFKIVH